MGKPTGFLDYPRDGRHERDPKERLLDFEEVYAPVPEERLRTQAARCMDCGVPFCHTGTLLSGMAQGCPVNNLVPEWNDLVHRGLWREAWTRLAATNSFPEITGRVCPAPCEGSCTVSLHGDAVTIKLLEQTIADRAFAEGWVDAEPPAARTGKRVAVVGSGPAGLTVASQLNRAGHDVMVFERADRPGGLLVYGIPNMKLDKKVVERRIELLLEEGVRFTTRVEVGKDLAAARLVREYDAVVLCGGATQARELPIEGRSLGGIHLAMEYLTASTRAVLAGQPGASAITARGRHVVVMGGGDTGTDCVATALRQGAKSVTQVEILPRPPERRRPDNPWPEWPKVFRVDYGQEEAHARFGRDPRAYGVTAKRFLGDAERNVRELHLVEVEWARGPGDRPAPRDIPGTDRVIPADLVLLALGFLGPERPLILELGLKTDERGNVWTDATRMTSLPGVFSAGDMQRGQSLVVWAIRDGRLTAQQVDRYLSSGETVLTP